MARPEAGELQGSDEAELFAVTRERVGESAGAIEVGSEDLGRDERLGFESVGHRFT